MQQDILSHKHAYRHVRLSPVETIDDLFGEGSGRGDLSTTSVIKRSHRPADNGSEPRRDTVIHIHSRYTVDVHIYMVYVCVLMTYNAQRLSQAKDMSRTAPRGGVGASQQHHDASRKAVGIRERWSRNDGPG